MLLFFNSCFTLQSSSRSRWWKQELNLQNWDKYLKLANAFGKSFFAISISNEEKPGVSMILILFEKTIWTTLVVCFPRFKLLEISCVWKLLLVKLLIKLVFPTPDYPIIKISWFWSIFNNFSSKTKLLLSTKKIE